MKKFIFVALFTFLFAPNTNSIKINTGLFIKTSESNAKIIFYYDSSDLNNKLFFSFIIEGLKKLNFQKIESIKNIDWVFHDLHINPNANKRKFLLECLIDDEIIFSETIEAAEVANQKEFSKFILSKFIINPRETTRSGLSQEQSYESRKIEPILKVSSTQNRYP